MPPFSRLSIHLYLLEFFFHASPASCRHAPLCSLNAGSPEEVELTLGIQKRFTNPLASGSHIKPHRRRGKKMVPSTSYHCIVLAAHMLPYLSSTGPQEDQTHHPVGLVHGCFPYFPDKLERPIRSVAAAKHRHLRLQPAEGPGPCDTAPGPLPDLLNVLSCLSKLLFLLSGRIYNSRLENFFFYCSSIKQSFSSLPSLAGQLTSSNPISERSQLVGGRAWPPGELEKEDVVPKCPFLQHPTGSGTDTSLIPRSSSLKRYTYPGT